MTARILLVDDEQAIVDAVAYALRGDGFEVDVCMTGDETLAAIDRQAYDLAILDIMLPDLSGVEVCRRIRAQTGLPILMLTARDAEVDRVVGLDSGADDYVTKPFSMAELLSRVRAILRRRDLDRASDRSRLQVGGLTLDLERHEAEVDGSPVRLTVSELKLLTLLARQPGRVFTREELMKHLWESEYVGDERACDAHVANLRRKIEADPAEPKRILSVRGVGYKLSPV
jgi:two-component system response regulator RegX3